MSDLRLCQRQDLKFWWTCCLTQTLCRLHRRVSRHRCWKTGFCLSIASRHHQDLVRRWGAGRCSRQ
ncbi:hypothetical protein Hanom_Chr16g01454021 [Helianthus anomalus]